MTYNILSRRVGIGYLPMELDNFFKLYSINLQNDSTERSD
ncbi:hypothetical protein M2326_000265 [Flavobacterium sp. 7A]|nr:hypothetical protein [Flavobacterium sp. 7A]